MHLEFRAAVNTRGTETMTKVPLRILAFQRRIELAMVRGWFTGWPSA